MSNKRAGFRPRRVFLELQIASLEAGWLHYFCQLSNTALSHLQEYGSNFQECDRRHRWTY